MPLRGGLRLEGLQDIPGQGRAVLARMDIARLAAKPGAQRKACREKAQATASSR